MLTASAVLRGCLGMAFSLQGNPLSMYVPSLFMKHSVDILHNLILLRFNAQMICDASWVLDSPLSFLGI